MVRLDSQLLSAVAAARKERGLTQSQLARMAVVSRQTIVELERGGYNPSTALALRLAVLLEKSVEELFELPKEEVATLMEAVGDAGLGTLFQGLENARTDKEKELLEAIGRRGELTVARAALETSLSVAEADQRLSKLAAKGYLRVSAQGGGMTYAFWEQDE